MEDVHERNGGLLAGLIFCAIVLIARIGYLYVANPLRFPIKTVKVTAPYQYVARKPIETVLDEYINKSYFTINSVKLREDLLNISWVRDASVLRIWPDTLSVTITEKIPVCFWNLQLMTEDGKLFDTDTKDFSLPKLTGPVNQQLKVLQIYQKLSKILLEHNLYAQGLHLQENQNWELSLSNGILLYLGKQNLEQRVERFSKAYSLVFADKQSCIVDLRYARGMAIRWNQ